MLCRIACQWAGVTISEGDIKGLSKRLVAMFESGAKIGPAHWIGRNSRNRVEKWVRELVNNVRNKKINPAEHSPLSLFSRHRDNKGNLLDLETAAVEIINILRPIVAISIYINSLALAVHHLPTEREKLRSGDEKYTHMFIQEVRRFYPFFPFVVALVKKDFIWNGYPFKKGTLTLLDLYGTNHDPTIWEKPELFNPDRFATLEHNYNLFDLIPQGGGDFLGHRCAGEWVTIELMKEIG